MTTAECKPAAAIAVIGAGWWAQGWHLPHLTENPDSYIAAIVDVNHHPVSTLEPNLVSLQELSDKYKAPTYSSIEALLQDKAVGPTLDGAIVVTPHATHYDVGKILLEEATRRHASGEKPLHVLMEKPMTTEVHEAYKLYKLVKGYKEMGDKGTFLINHSANYRVQAQKARELVAAGAIGKVRHVSAFFASPLMWIFDDPSNKGWNEPDSKMIGNGFAWGQQSHLLGWIYHACGSQVVPKQVFCAMNHSPTTGADISHAATVICNDDIGMSVSGTTLLPGNEHAEENPVGKKIQIHIYGSEGAILYCGTDFDTLSGRLELRRPSVNDGNPECPCGQDVGFDFENLDHEGSGPESLQAFLDACHGREYYDGANALQGLRIIQTLDCMYRSNASRHLEQVLYCDEE